MHEDSTEEEEMRRQRRMMVMKDMTKKIRPEGSMDAANRWWVAELLAADCKKAWIHPEEEETFQKWYSWLEKLQKEDDRRKLEELHQQKVGQMIKSEEGSAGYVHKITKPTAWRGGAQILKKKRMAGCWTAVKQRGKNGQIIGNVTKACRMWRVSLLEK